MATINASNRADQDGVFCDVFIIRRKWRYYNCVIIGLILFTCYRNDIFRSKLASDSIFLEILKFLDYIVLPRSIGEINIILEHLGQEAYISAILLYFLCFIIFFYNIISIFKDMARFDRHIIQSKFVFWLGGFGALFTILIRPALFSPGPFVTNYIDEKGFWLLRESLVISIQYMLFSVLIVNIYIVVRAWRVHRA